MNTFDPETARMGVVFFKDPPPKIIQLLMTPNDLPWQENLLGLGDDGVTYYASEKRIWKLYMPALGSKVQE